MDVLAICLWDQIGYQDQIHLNQLKLILFIKRDRGFSTFGPILFPFPET